MQVKFKYTSNPLHLKLDTEVKKKSEAEISQLNSRHHKKQVK